jgi:hypothetical protein
MSDFGNESFGPYKREFESMSQDMRTLQRELAEFRVTMAGFEGRVTGAAKAWAFGISFIGLILSFVVAVVSSGN